MDRHKFIGTGVAGVASLTVIGSGKEVGIVRTAGLSCHNVKKI